MDGGIQEGILPPWVERAAHPIRPSVVGHLRLLLAVAAAGDRVFTKRELRPIRPTAKGWVFFIPKPPDLLTALLPFRWRLTSSGRAPTLHLSPNYPHPVSLLQVVHCKFSRRFKCSSSGWLKVILGPILPQKIMLACHSYTYMLMRIFMFVRLKKLYFLLLASG